MTPDERFDEYTYPEPNTGCFIWAGPEDGKGYGVLFLGRRNHTKSAHRFAWERANGPIPKRLCVCHKCDTPCCVNPDHLFLGTHLQNMNDMARKWRSPSVATGVLPFGVYLNGRRFTAKVWFSGKGLYLGTFDTLSEAAAVALAAKTALRQEKETLMPHPAGPNQVPKPASLSRGEVPKPDAPPPPTREGINSLHGPAKG